VKRDDAGDLFGESQLSALERVALQRRWLHLTREVMPALARERGWPVRHDHCFQRILLDNACGGRWYDHVKGRPAYAHASDAALAEAVRLGEECVGGEVEVVELNRRSLGWREGLRSARAVAIHPVKR